MATNEQTALKAKARSEEEEEDTPLEKDVKALRVAINSKTLKRSEMRAICTEIIARAIRRLDREVEVLNKDISNEATSRGGLLQICTESDQVMYVSGKANKAGRGKACEVATAALSGYRYEMEDLANSAPVFLGVIGGTTLLIEQAERVNEEKNGLKELCGVIKDKRMRVTVKDGKGGHTTANKSLIRVILASLKESDINLLAAWRKIPILNAQPKMIAFSETQSRAVYKKKKHEILEMLAHSRNIKARDDLGTIRSLDDSHFALAMERYPRYRANVKYVGLDKKNKGRTSLTVSLPILYSAERLKAAPSVHFPKENAENSVRRRRPNITATPILESLPVHRYIENTNAK